MDWDSPPSCGQRLPVTAPPPFLPPLCQDLDSEFIEVLRTQCRVFIERRGRATLEQVSELLRASGLSKVGPRAGVRMTGDW